LAGVAGLEDKLEFQIKRRIYLPPISKHRLWEIWNEDSRRFKVEQSAIFVQFGYLHHKGLDSLYYNGYDLALMKGGETDGAGILL